MECTNSSEKDTISDHSKKGSEEFPEPFILKCTSDWYKNGGNFMDEILNKDERFRYMLLDRMRTDCEYYLGNGGRNAKDLWAGDEQLQIEYMAALYNSFDEDSKPQWLTLDEIYEFKELMCDNSYK